VPDIYVDADGCPVKGEIYRVASRYDLKVFLVANARMRVPDRDSVALVVVGDQLDAADDWIVEHITKNDIVITDDIPLASRSLKRGARVITSRGRILTETSIGAALATRDLLSYLRGFEMIGGGPAPFEKRDRSEFLQRLDETIHAIRREQDLSE